MSNNSNNIQKVLTIAGSDSGGGAGIQADLKTFQSLGIYGLSAITALTAQNTEGVYDIQNANPDFFRTQLDCVLSDIKIGAVKTGMLANAEIVDITSELLRKYSIKNIVIDPVMVSKHGAKLLQDDAVCKYKQNLFKLADIITPNLNEAAFLINENKISSKNEMKTAARKIKQTGCKYVVVKGGHLEGDKSSDLFFDGEKFVWLTCQRINSIHTHGTGCTFSAAIAAFLALEKEPLEAVKLAKGFLTSAIISAFPVGKGIGPVNHFWASEKIDINKFHEVEILKD